MSTPPGRIGQAKSFRSTAAAAVATPSAAPAPGSTTAFPVTFSTAGATATVGSGSSGPDLSPELKSSLDAFMADLNNEKLRAIIDRVMAGTTVAADPLKDGKLAADQKQGKDQRSQKKPDENIDTIVDALEKVINSDKVLTKMTLRELLTTTKKLSNNAEEFRKMFLTFAIAQAKANDEARKKQQAINEDLVARFNGSMANFNQAQATMAAMQAQQLHLQREENRRLARRIERDSKVRDKRFLVGDVTGAITYGISFGAGVCISLTAAPVLGVPAAVLAGVATAAGLASGLKSVGSALGRLCFDRCRKKKNFSCCLVEDEETAALVSPGNSNAPTDDVVVTILNPLSNIDARANADAKVKREHNSTPEVSSRYRTGQQNSDTPEFRLTIGPDAKIIIEALTAALNAKTLIPSQHAYPTATSPGGGNANGPKRSPSSSPKPSLGSPQPLILSNPSGAAVPVTVGMTSTSSRAPTLAGLGIIAPSPAGSMSP